MNIPVLVDLTSADVTKPIENMADRLSAAGQTVVLGMLAVFSVLAVLWLVLAIMGKFFTAAPKKEKKQEILKLVQKMRKNIVLLQILKKAFQKINTQKQYSRPLWPKNTA